MFRPMASLYKLIRYRMTKKDAVNREAVLKLVVDFFGSTKKAEAWMRYPNPLLGGITPEFMIRIGRSDRLLKFVHNCLEENRRPDEPR